MWNQLSAPWQAAFEEAWQAYCAGSIPIGAVLANRRGEVLIRGRNRVNETTAPEQQTCNNRLAHAEINVLMQIAIAEKIDPADVILYTTQEPCVLCFGAISLSHVRIVRFAARDPIAGGVHLSEMSQYIKEKQIDVQGPQTKVEQLLEDVQRVLRTDYVLRNLEHEKAEKILAAYSEQTPQSVALGRKWFAENRLQEAIETGTDIATLVEEIATAGSESPTSSSQ